MLKICLSYNKRRIDMTNEKANPVQLTCKELSYVFGGIAGSGTGINAAGCGTGINAAGGGTGVYADGNGTGK